MQEKASAYTWSEVVLFSFCPLSLTIPRREVPGPYLIDPFPMCTGVLLVWGVLTAPCNLVSAEKLEENLNLPQLPNKGVFLYLPTTEVLPLIMLNQTSLAILKSAFSP